MLTIKFGFPTRPISRFILTNIYTIGIIFFICFFCFLPRDKASVGKDEYADIVFHVLLFALLSLVASVGFIKQNQFTHLKYFPIVSSVILSVGLGILIEIIQHYWVLNRTSDIGDILFDVLGATIGIGVFYWIYGIRKRYCR